MTRIQEIIDQAYKEVHQLEKCTQEEIEELKSKAKLSGKREGASQANSLVKKIDALQSSIESEMLGQVNDLAFDIAHKLLLHQVETSAQSVVSIAQEVLSATPEARQVYLRANPMDVHILLDNKSRLVEILDRAKDIDIRSDVQVKRGGVLIQTEFGVIDAQLETQLEQICLATMNGV